MYTLVIFIIVNYYLFILHYIGTTYQIERGTIK